ncbi:hypothetical protein PHYSODRAFT_471803 [Phytophthora sojae]|uniref:DDE Tnp4 domain-containing protein n=1 Tax=Phytophthora sojae (strain P6497) TaxID=1094619 RepID=G4YM09_PHYSP|nr:hypothetical protein PHYSODRAFT_471803 [Phytophthora sojae]EGZ27539.1 hypothetical protein PHYSODRAFT_471803 [Phytophthora sojae]|eukprot:XP_009514814.1 hypothetical protein PHYSODRAFT_471803 [Phytophthora sojae]
MAKKNCNVQIPTDRDTLNAYYNGWLHGVMLTGVLCYGFNGTLIWGKHNFPGSWNDGEMRYQLQRQLSDPAKTIEGGRCATDSNAAMTNRIFTLLKDGDLERASLESRAGLLAMGSAITTIRQDAEWGYGQRIKVLQTAPVAAATRSRYARIMT